MAGAIQDNLFIGKRAQELRGLLKIQYPMEHGVVTDWDDMERIWNWVYNDGLKALSEEVRGKPTRADHQHPVLLTEAPLNPRQNRDVAAQIFFETFNVPAFFTSVQAILSLCVSPHQVRLTLQILDRANNGYCVGFGRWSHARGPGVRGILYATCHSADRPRRKVCLSPTMGRN